MTALFPLHRPPHAVGENPRAHVSARTRLGAAVALLALAALPGPLLAQQPTVAAAARVAPAPASAFDSSAIASMKWREIGPYRGGRSVAVGGSVARPNEYWMGTTGSGVFKSTDGGRNWQPASDGYFGGSIGAITVDPANPDIVYVGTGETPIRGNVTNGDGVWKTTDGGKTWTHLGLTEARQIDRIVIHPTNPRRLWLAALGNVFKPTKDRGVYRSDDAGATWKQVLFRSDSAGAIDVIVDPSNPDVLYVSFWQAGRMPWMLSSGGRWSGIFKSTDGGDNWTDISRATGLPKGVMGKIGLAISPVNPQRLWAQVEADEGGLYRTDDGGKSWTLVNDDRSLRQRAWYYSHLHADPKDANTVYALNTGFYRSTDGGKTMKNIPVPHGDNHDLWIAANDPLRMIESNDGGANVSIDGGKTWTEQDYATAQFYHVTTSNDFPYHVCGAQQDNSTLCGPSAKAGGITMADWYDVGGGESGYIAVDPRDPNIAYAGSYGGLLTRKDRRTEIERNVSPWPLNPMGHSSEDIQYRFQWTYPIVFSRHDPKTLYAGGSQLFRTNDEGYSWTIVSPPLARMDPKTMGPSGGPITKDQTGVETYGTIFAFDESPITAGLLWAGSDDGNVQLSRDNGATWTNVTPPKSMLPDFARISIIEPGHYSPGTAYVAANRYQMADMQAYLLKTADYGKTWTRIDKGITGDSEFARVIREDPARPGLLFAGTERGVWVSFDDGASWRSLRQNLPIVPVHDITI
ncbi:MAG: WD40/YVTN/BNR-like repeat-containing protein, partial [Gemmatimonadaceae bacterium]